MIQVGEERRAIDLWRDIADFVQVVANRALPVFDDAGAVPGREAVGALRRADRKNFKFAGRVDDVVDAQAVGRAPTARRCSKHAG